MRFYEKVITKPVPVALFILGFKNASKIFSEVIVRDKGKQPPDKALERHKKSGLNPILSKLKNQFGLIYID
jgi:hypothetical protein